MIINHGIIIKYPRWVHYILNRCFSTQHMFSLLYFLAEAGGYGHVAHHSCVGGKKALQYLLNSLLQTSSVTSKLTTADNLQSLNLVCSCYISGTSDKKKVILKKICRVNNYGKKYYPKKCSKYGTDDDDGCCRSVYVITRKINLVCRCYTQERFILYNDLVSAARAAVANGHDADGHCSDAYKGGHGHGKHYGKGYGYPSYY